LFLTAPGHSWRKVFQKLPIITKRSVELMDRAASLFAIANLPVSSAINVQAISVPSRCLRLDNDRVGSCSLQHDF